MMMPLRFSIQENNVNIILEIVLNDDMGQLKKWDRYGDNKIVKNIIL